jgi:hypothetical protein
LLLKGAATKADDEKAHELYQLYLEDVKNDQRDEAAEHDESNSYLVSADDYEAFPSLI